MKPHSRTISTLAGAACAAIFLIPSPAPGAEENFFQKFIVQEPMNWSGPYIGFNNGATFNNFHVGKHMTDVDLTDQFYDIVGVLGDGDVNFATFDTPGHHHNDTETIGGGQTGFRFQFGHIVVGGEGGFSGNGSTAEGKSNDFQTNQLFIDGGDQLQQPIGGITAETVFQSKQKVETTWNGFVGGNIGFAWNRFLFTEKAVPRSPMFTSSRRTKRTPVSSRIVRKYAMALACRLPSSSAAAHVACCNPSRDRFLSVKF